jgi:hypothetical protein
MIPNVLFHSCDEFTIILQCRKQIFLNNNKKLKCVGVSKLLTGTVCFSLDACKKTGEIRNRANESMREEGGE